MASWTSKRYLWRFLFSSLFVLAVLAACLQGVSAEEQDLPSESQCRPYIEKALKDLESGDAHSVSVEDKNDSEEADVAVDNSEENNSKENDNASNEERDEPSVEVADEPYVNEVEDGSLEAGVEADDDSKEQTENAADEESGEAKDESEEQDGDSKENNADEPQNENDDDSKEVEEDAKNEEVDKSDENDSKEDTKENDEVEGDDEKQGSDEAEQENEADSKEEEEDSKDSAEETANKDDHSQEEEESTEKDGSVEEQDGDSAEADSKEDADGSDEQHDSAEKDGSEETDEPKTRQKREIGDDQSEEEAKEAELVESEGGEENDSKESEEKAEDGEDKTEDQSNEEDATGDKESEENAEEDNEESSEMPEEDLLMEIDIPDNLRSRDHVSELLRLDEESTEAEVLIEKSADVILRELKRIYDNAIKPLEILYKYRDLSNRHFGDPEIFSKPLVLFMGPWSGGKSSLINYLTDNEFTEWSLRTGAEPSPAYFNILMYGDEPQVLDGTQLAADWTFSGLQKFGQGLEERLRGLKLPNSLLKKVNIVEIPGILEVRKQVSRVFPFNDACQWFIDRADIIFLVYDPSKLDIGPETEAILDQLKGRESQSRIILNKADQVKPEELMRVQSALIWNISPLMSSAQPPVMYTTSLWSMPYESGSPVRLLQAQEKEFLRDLRTAIDKRVENKIASARRFAVRVRNHAKMVDCYLTTYYNHKTIFGNKKVVAEAIIEHPQNYHIYEGLSTLTNISRYDLPDPETYRDFFRLNPLYDFQQLSATCTYFRGCPINRLDVAIAYDLPELVGKYKKMVETATPQGMPKS